MNQDQTEQADYIVPPPPEVKRFKLVACEILARELYAVAANSMHIIDIILMPKGLHDLPTGQMQARLQEQIDALEPDKYHAILLAYARCNDGVVGLQARDIPLVITKAHDCITLFMGSRDAYDKYFNSHPGTYYYTTGWVERNDQGQSASVMEKLGLDKSYQEYVDRYGEDNAQYITEMIDSWKTSYNRMTYIDLPVGKAGGYQQQARQKADQLGWKFRVLPGSLTLLERLLTGQWDQDFLIIKPGQQIAASNDDQVIKAVKAETANPSETASKDNS